MLAQLQNRLLTSSRSRLLAIMGLSPLLLNTEATHAQPKDNWQFSLGTYLWLQDFQGDTSYQTEPLDEQAILGYDESDKRGLVYNLSIEHKHLRWLPQLRAQYSKVTLSHTERSTVTGGIIPVTSEVVTNAETDLSHTDLIFYYPLLRSNFQIDLGIAGRNLNGGIEADDGESTGTVEIKETAPLVFGAAKMKFKVDDDNTYFVIGAEAMGLEYKDVSHLDYKLSISLHTPVGLRFESGARKFDLDYQGDNDSAEISVKGFFTGISYHF